MASKHHTRPDFSGSLHTVSCDTGTRLANISGVFFMILLMLVLPLAAQQKDIDQLLQLDLEDLTKLRVVSATRVPQVIVKVPATVRVITRQQIQDYGYLTLEDALSDLPGFQFRNIQGFNSYVFQRGIPGQNNKILVMINGIQINELNSGGFYGGWQYNLASVERIEIVYGPASALYGTNAVSGIINLITTDPEQSNPRRFSLTGGSFDTWIGDFIYSVFNNETRRGFSVSGVLSTTEKADLAGRDGDYNWTNQMDNFEDNVSLDGFIRSGNFSLGFVFQDKEASRATVHRSYETGYRDDGVNWHIRFFNLHAGYEWNRSERWEARTLLYYRNSTVLDDTIPTIVKASDLTPGFQERWYRPNDLFGSETQVTVRFAPDIQFTAGAVIERERLAESFSVTVSESEDETPSAPPAPDRIQSTRFSLFGQIHYSITDELDCYAGIRYDDSDYSGSVNTPRAGIVYNHGALTVKILYAEAFRAPRPWDYTDGLGNPDLKPEEMKSFELAGEVRLSDYFTLDGSLYRNKLQGILVREEIGEDWKWVNLERIRTNGAEARLEYRKDRLSLFAAYTFNDSQDGNGNTVPEISRHTVSSGFRYVVSSHWRGSLRLQYLGERTNPVLIQSTGTDLIGDALVAHMVISLLNLQGWDFHVMVRNLLDEEYYHPSNLMPDRYRQPQRSILIRAGYSFP